MFFVVILLFLLIGFNSGAEICTATRITMNVTAGGSGVNAPVLFMYQADLQLQTLKNNPLVQISISNVVTTSTNGTKYGLTPGKKISASIDGKRAKECTSIGGVCSWLVDNTTMSLNLPLTLGGEVGTMDLVNIVVDGGGISLTDGQYFSRDYCRQVAEATSDFPSYSFHTQQCCLEFKDVPDPVAPAAECQSFSGFATFYNRGVVFANVNATFTKFGNGYNIEVTSATGPQQAYYSLTQNRQFGCYGTFPSQTSCETLLPMTSDYKVLYPLDIWKASGQTWSYSINFGRIISRNGTFEKEEGMRFTPESPCLYQGEGFDNSYAATSQFCCQQF